MNPLLEMFVALPLFFQEIDIAPAAHRIADNGSRASGVTVSAIRSAGTWPTLRACMRHGAEIVGRISLGSPGATQSVPIVVQRLGSHTRATTRPGGACATMEIGGYPFIVVAVKGEADFSARATLEPSRMNASQTAARDDPGTVTVTITY